MTTILLYEAKSVIAGCRLHALYKSAKQSPLVKRVFVSPGNAGMDSRDVLPPLSEFDLLEAIRKHHIDFVIPVNDAAVVQGTYDLCNRYGVRSVGPSYYHARLEGSKKFCKEFCETYGVATAPYELVNSEDTTTSIMNAVERFGLPLVIKADGLARGKGVLFGKTAAESHRIVEQMLVRHPGIPILLEKKLQGEECTIMYMRDGDRSLRLEPIKDRKRASTDPDAPNTGGMGGYAPFVIDKSVMAEIERQIERPFMVGLNTFEPYRGVLNLNLMLTEDGPKLIESNCRFGDPELLSLMPRLKTDLIELLLASTEEGGLRRKKVYYNRDVAAVSLVLAAEGYGYKEDLRIGDVVEGLEEAERHARVYYGAIIRRRKQLQTGGGRVLTVVGTSHTLPQALTRAQEAASMIIFRGKTVHQGILL